MKEEKQVFTDVVASLKNFSYRMNIELESGNIQGNHQSELIIITKTVQLFLNFCCKSCKASPPEWNVKCVLSEDNAHPVVTDSGSGRCIGVLGNDSYQTPVVLTDDIGRMEAWWDVLNILMHHCPD